MYQTVFRQFFTTVGNIGRYIVNFGHIANCGIRAVGVDMCTKQARGKTSRRSAEEFFTIWLTIV
jgi:hypothetical protein